MDYVRNAIDEIRTHHKVSGYKFINNDELEIHFVENYKDLIIPISPQMNYDNILTVFYYYVANYRGK